MKLLEQVQRGRLAAPRRTTIYGPHGVGKSTFGAMAEAPIFIQTEDGLINIDCERFPLATKYADVIAALGELYIHPVSMKHSRVIAVKLLRESGRLALV